MDKSIATTNPLLRWAIVIMLTILVTRLISLGLYPLYDTTEARYGEMARIMFETQNWVTPQFDYNVPFWGKPPFQTWISATSFVWLGVSEFSARLPHFLCAIVVLLLVLRLTTSLTQRNDGLFACFILSSTLGFIIAAGMVMTDAALLMAITLAMVSFWHNFIEYQQGNHSKFYGHVFFAALALGLLIKGPVAVVLIGIALVCWSVWQRCLVAGLKSLPWLTGLPLMLVLTLPWYIWAELRSPGFLEYFIVGEHIQRFLVSGWQGDLYGTAHTEPRGMIWLFWLACASPWSFILIAMGVTQLRKRNQVKPHVAINGQEHGINKYLICWMISPLLLFTVAGNILPAYVLPGLSAMAILIAINSRLTRNSLYAALSTFVILLLVLIVFTLDLTNKSAESELLDDANLPFQSQLYYWKKRPFSAQFYSKGQAQLLDDKEKLSKQIQSQQAFFIGISHHDYQSLSVILDDNCTTINQTKKRLLLRCN